MKQSYFKILLLFAIIQICLNLSAHDFEVDGIYYNKLSDNTVSVTYCGNTYDKYSGVVSIPETVKYGGVSYAVTEIGGFAFADCLGVTSVTIPNSVTEIANYAFSNCTGLTSVTIPNSVKKLYDYVFDKCSNLHSLTLGSGLTSIGSWSSSSSSSYIHYPEKVIWLSNTPPRGYDGIKGSVNYVANEKYWFSSGTKYVYDNLSSLFADKGIVYVPVNPYERTCDIIDCVYSDEAADIQLNDKVMYKGVEMSVRNMRPYAFYSNCFVNKLAVNRSGAIADYCFSGCANLEKIIIPQTITDIGSYAFRRCSALTSIQLTNTGSIGEGAFSGSATKNDATLIIAPSVTDIGEKAFSGCSALTSIQLTNTGSIGDNAFQNSATKNEATLTIAPSVTDIGDYAFIECSKLADIDIRSTGEIGNYAFKGCSKLADIDIRCTGKIGNYAFAYCTSAVSLTIAPTITSVGYYAFSGCFSIADVTIEDANSAITLESNGSSPMFADCPLDEVYIGRKLEYSTYSSKGYSPFYRNESLRSVEITDAETKIYDYEFYGCTNLQNVKIGDGVESFGKYAFSGCSKIKSFEFGKSVKSIGEEAFSDCTSMTSLTSHNPMPPTCGNEALDDINKWECTLYVPTECLAAYQQADQWKNFFFINDELGKVFTVDGLYYKIQSPAENTCELIAPEQAPSSVRTRAQNRTQDTHITVNPTVEYNGTTYKVVGIGDNAFSEFSALTQISLPETITNIGSEAFAACTNLNNVVVDAEIPPMVKENSFADKTYSYATLVVKPESEYAYRNASVWKNFTRVASGIDGIADYAAPEVAARYDLNGNSVGRNYRGVVITRYTDGTTRKQLAQ